MNEQKLAKLLKQAVLEMTQEKPKNLLEVGGGVHEQALCHRIALHLEKLIPGYNIDCEYNKNCDTPKMNLNGKLFRPDIVVHKRGTPVKKNLLIIEVKRKRNSVHDIKKLIMGTDPFGYFQYKLGVFIRFPQGRPEYRWFLKGKEVLDFI